MYMDNNKNSNKILKILIKIFNIFTAIICSCSFLAGLFIWFLMSLNPNPYDDTPNYGLLYYPVFIFVISFICFYISTKLIKK